ncbi:Sensor protein KdpD [compost metagenome]
MTKKPGHIDLSNQNKVDRSKKRGYLKVFISFSPGAGKTYAMLCSAHKDVKEGKTVVVGDIQYQHRSNLESFLREIEYLPRLETQGIQAKGHGFNLDYALNRKPQLIVLDNLAHHNPEGSRHKRRYQDIEELLRAGIDVFTTLNIQQLESLADIVSPIVAFSEPERIPDHVLDRADFVEFIDCEPKELIDKFQKGLIFQDESQRKGYETLFQEESLTVLREIALRMVAKQLNRISGRIPVQAKQNDEAIKDHILVCLSSAESNKKVIRTAARMAEAFHARFTALYVETSQNNNYLKSDNAGLRENFRLAEQLGAQIATVYGDDIPLQIAEYVKTSLVSKIVLGRSPNRKGRFSKSTIVDKLTALVPNIETYIIPYSQLSLKNRFQMFRYEQLFSIKDIVKTLTILSVCTAAGLWFYELGFREANVITLYILGALVNAMITQGRLYSGITSIISVLVFNFFFTEPRFSFQANDPSYIVTFLVMMVASFITSTLTMRVREQARHSAQKAYRTEVLLETSRKLQQARNSAAIMEETARQMVKLLDKTVAFYPVEDGKTVTPILIPRPELTTEELQDFTGEKERLVADWVLRNNKRAGATTDTFSNVRCLYLAVRGGEDVYAVAAIDIGEHSSLDVFEKSLIIAMLGECGLALEKELLSERQKSISIQIQQEQLRANLLRGISHDLRTPLTSISGNAGILISNSSVLNEEQKKSLYSDIYDDSVWLIQLVENVLAISRIENGTLSLNFQAELVEDVISEALQRVKRKKDDHIIHTTVQNELLMANMDSRLIVQVLVNLMDNAMKYTNSGTLITISVRREKDMVVFEVADCGPGIPDDYKPRIFEMFYTLNNKTDGRRGLGLGLSLCKSIVQAHGGAIGIRDNDPNGTIFYFTIPVSEVNIHE